MHLTQKRGLFSKKIEIMENEELITRENDSREFFGYDLFGFSFNKKYPPNKEKYGDDFYGYPTKGEGILLLEPAPEIEDIKPV